MRIQIKKSSKISDLGLGASFAGGKIPGGITRSPSRFTPHVSFRTGTGILRYVW